MTLEQLMGRWHKNGRPDYPPTTSLEQWYVNARRSTEWAEKARQAALERQRRRHYIAGMLWLVAAILIALALVLSVT